MEPQYVTCRVQIEMDTVGYVVRTSLLRDAGLRVWIDVGGDTGIVSTGACGWMNEGLDVNVEQSGLFVLRAVKEKLLILVDSDALPTWEKPDLIPSCCEDRNAQ